jgi:hypothetical protein
MAGNKTVAATIAAILVANGKTKSGHITKAIEVYRQCLDELKKTEEAAQKVPAADAAPTQWDKGEEAKIKAYKGSAPA